jgi:hypothetical protein
MAWGNILEPVVAQQDASEHPGVMLSSLGHLPHKTIPYVGQ